MILRPYIHSHDFDLIKGWITDKRIHSMWCADHMKFPLDSQDFEDVMAEMFIKHGDCPFVAVDDDGRLVGFICCSIDPGSKESMLAFVLIDPAQRGKGYGKQMLGLAAKYCFEILNADAVQLNVFTANAPARKCYESVGFTERRTDPDAFKHEDELWGRCNMVMTKDSLYN